MWKEIFLWWRLVIHGRSQSILVLTTYDRHTNTLICYHACFSTRKFIIFKTFLKIYWLECRWSIPVCLFFSWIYMRPKYHWTQILVRTEAVVISWLLDWQDCNRACLYAYADLECWLVLTHSRTKILQLRTEEKVMPLWLWERHFMALVSNALSNLRVFTWFVLANATEEFLVRRSPLYEVLHSQLHITLTLSPFSIFKGRRSTRDVGASNQRHPSSLVRTCRHAHHFLERSNQ